MSLLLMIFGEGRDLDSFQMAARAIAVFFGALAFIRIAGRRSFGQRSPFDYVVVILLGATLSRVIVGASPAIPTAVASLVIALIHRIVAWACIHSPRLKRVIVGAEREGSTKTASSTINKCRPLSSRRQTCSRLRDGSCIAPDSKTWRRQFLSAMAK